jgi:hypothetical protein
MIFRAPQLSDADEAVFVVQPKQKSHLESFQVAVPVTGLLYRPGGSLFPLHRRLAGNPLHGT